MTESQQWIISACSYPAFSLVTSWTSAILTMCDSGENYIWKAVHIQNKCDIPATKILRIYTLKIVFDPTCHLNAFPIVLQSREFEGFAGVICLCAHLVNIPDATALLFVTTRLWVWGGGGGWCCTQANTRPSGTKRAGGGRARTAY